MRAIAYCTAGYSADLAHAFADGCARNGVRCELRDIHFFDGPRYCDVVWMYGLHDTRKIFDAYAGKAQRVTGDLGYWRERASELPLNKRHIRIAVEAEQPDAHLALRAHPSDRFEALQLGIEPVQLRGEYVLVTGHCPIQAQRNGFEYGQWEAQQVERLRWTTLRSIQVRAKQNCEPLSIKGATRNTDKEASSAIRNAWAVVCRSGNIGADAILHGVPVIANSGPGAVYHREQLHQINDLWPLDAPTRLRALSDIAYCQWTEEEFGSGAMFAHLQTEGLVH